VWCPRREKLSPEIHSSSVPNIAPSFASLRGFLRYYDNFKVEAGVLRPHMAGELPPAANTRAGLPHVTPIKSLTGKQIGGLRLF